MRWFLLAGISLALCALSGHAQTAKDVPEVASFEIQRRGNHVERTGTYRSGLMAAALSPPADDSNKWFLTLVVQGGHTGCDKMKAVIADKEMHCWIDTVDPLKSTLHYQLRSIDDPTQADWFAKIKPKIEEQHLALPIIIIQPPRSGQFGKPETVVKLLGGVMTAKDLSDKIRASIIAYVQAIEEPRSAGVTQDIQAVAPPFQVPPRDPPGPAGPPPSPASPLNFEFPPSAPTALSIDQINQLVPGADPKFVVDCLIAKDSDPKLVALKWQIWKQDHPSYTVEPVKPEQNACTPDACVNPQKPALQLPPQLLALFIVYGAITFGLGYLSKRVITSLAERIAKRTEDATTIANLMAKLSQLDQAQPMQTISTAAVPLFTATPTVQPSVPPLGKTG